MGSTGLVEVEIHNVFYLPRDHLIDVSRDFVGAVLSSQVTALLSLGSIGLTKLEIMAFVISVPVPIPFPIPLRMPRFQCRDLQMARKVFVAPRTKG